VLYFPFSETTPTRCPSNRQQPICISSTFAATPHAQRIDQAIDSARRQIHGVVLSAAWECDANAACAYIVKIQDDQGALHSVRIAEEADATAPTLKPQASVAGFDLAEPRLRSERFAYAELGAGQSAGLGNVILNPVLTIGGRATARSDSFPNWSADGDLRMIYGKTESSDPTTLRKTSSKPQLQEIRGVGHLIYDFHDNGGIEKVGVGLYTEFARALHRSPRYIPPETDDAYAAEEGDITRSMLNTGLDLRLALKESRIKSTLHNVIFLSGSRIAPNLLTYKPMLGFMWSNEFAITGSIDHPGLSLLTDMDFYFARKAGVGYLNSHDGLGGTKRELDLRYGLVYSFSPKVRMTVQSYGFNNLNRGTSSTQPTGFKDGLRVGMTWALD
jgi:hypothetical protein